MKKYIKYTLCIVFVISIFGYVLYCQYQLNNLSQQLSQSNDALKKIEAKNKDLSDKYFKLNSYIIDTANKVNVLDSDYRSFETTFADQVKNIIEGKPTWYTLD